jgi:aspartate racemase
MGPEATVDFMARVIAATRATSDQDHIHMLVDHNPQVPNRHAAIAGTAPSIGPDLAAMARRLEGAGADFLVMVCNTAHAFAGDIRAAVSIPFVSIIDVVMEALDGHPAQRVGLMAAEGCLQARLYQQALEQAGHEAVLWTSEELARFMDIIYRIKSGDRADDIAPGLRRLAAELEFRGADILVAGCTEVPMFLKQNDTTAPMLSSTDLLVRRTIELALNQPTTESPI